MNKKDTFDHIDWDKEFKDIDLTDKDNARFKQMEKEMLELDFFNDDIDNNKC